MTSPRIWVLTSTETSRAVVLRRGPSKIVASLSWDRASDTFEMGQWLKARVYEHRSDLSPDGRHMVYFAYKGATVGGYTVLSRVPWFRALLYRPQGDTWYGGGAFTASGALFLNGVQPVSDLPDGLEPASVDDAPHSTDGFHMGGLFAAMMERRGWAQENGSGYGVHLGRHLDERTRLEAQVVQGRKNRALVSLAYALVVSGDTRIEMPDWTWADRWQDGLHFASQGALWFARVTGDGRLSDLREIRDFSEMTYQRIVAPYAGVTQ